MALKGYKRYLIDKVPEKVLKNLPRSFEIIGPYVLIDLLITTTSGDKLNYQNYLPIISEAIKKQHKHISQVIPKNPVEGKYRVRSIYKVDDCMINENNLRILVNPSEVYYNTKLSSERQKIYDMCYPTDSICDMFAGVGPFSLLLATKCKYVEGWEWNAYACKLFHKNIQNNKRVRIKQNLKIEKGDTFDIILKKDLKKFNVFIINHPTQSLNIFPKIQKYFPPGSKIIMYSMVIKNEISEKIQLLNNIGVKNLSYSSVMDTSPAKKIIRFIFMT